MCFGVPAKVVSLGDKMTIMLRGRERQVIPMCDARPGDTVLITQGVATAVLSAEEAEELEKIFHGSD